MAKREEIRIGKDSGRVKVFARIRPLNKEEISKKVGCSLETSTNQINVLDGKNKIEKAYQFDHVFSSNQTNEQICERLSSPIVNSALEGFNGTLMTYGQTGTGKTYTLMAPDGITHDIIHRMFQRMDNDVDHEFKVTASYLQIYQEKIHDLLNVNSKIELNIRESPKCGIYVENLTEYVVRSPSQALSLIGLGRRRLIFAETKMNRTSSRSHSVFQLAIEKAPKKVKHGIEEASSKDVNKSYVEQSLNEENVVKLIGLADDVIVRGKIHLCDLAGSERVKKTHAAGERLSEAQHINSSLLELGNVIQALADNKKTHIPFRNSVLTRLLQESLGGNCKTSLIVCVSPSAKDLSETKSTLNFGSRAMKVTNTAYVNMEVDYKRLSDSLLETLEKKELELERLRNQISNLKEAQTNIAVPDTDSIPNESNNSMQQCDKQVSDPMKEITELQNTVLHKDECITKLEKDLKYLKESTKKDNVIAKAMLLTHIASLKVLTAEEIEEYVDKDKNCKGRNDWKQFIINMLQHCKEIAEYSKLFVNDPSSSPIMQHSDLRGEYEQAASNVSWLETNLKSIQGGKDVGSKQEVENMNIEYLKAELTVAKERIDEFMTEVLSDYKLQEVVHNGDSNTVPLMDLCKVVSEKSFLVCNAVLENRLLQKQMPSLTNQTKGEFRGRTANSTFSEILSKNVKKLAEDPADVDEKWSGFEVALSKIEDILSEKGIQNEKAEKQNGNYWNRPLLQSCNARKLRMDFKQKRRTLNRENTFIICKEVGIQTDLNIASGSWTDNEKVDAQFEGNNKSVITTVMTPLNALKHDSCNLEASKMRQKCQNASLQDDRTIVDDSISIQKVNENKHLKTNVANSTQQQATKNNTEAMNTYQTDIHTNITSTTSTIKDELKLNGKVKPFAGLSPLEISFFEEVEDSFSKLITDACDITSTIDEYVKLDSEIRNVKTEMRKQDLTEKTSKQQNDNKISNKFNLNCLKFVASEKSEEISKDSVNDSFIGTEMNETEGRLEGKLITDDAVLTRDEGSNVSAIETSENARPAVEDVDDNKVTLELNKLKKDLLLAQQQNRELTEKLDELREGNSKHLLELLSRKSQMLHSNSSINKFLLPDSVNIYGQNKTLECFPTSLLCCNKYCNCCTKFGFTDSNGFFCYGNPYCLLWNLLPAREIGCVKTANVYGSCCNATKIANHSCRGFESVQTLPVNFGTFQHDLINFGNFDRLKKPNENISHNNLMDKKDTESYSDDKTDTMSNMGISVLNAGHSTGQSFAASQEDVRTEVENFCNGDKKPRLDNGNNASSLSSSLLPVSNSCCSLNEPPSDYQNEMQEFVSILDVASCSDSKVNKCDFNDFDQLRLTSACNISTKDLLPEHEKRFIEEDQFGDKLTQFFGEIIGKSDEGKRKTNNEETVNYSSSNNDYKANGQQINCQSTCFDCNYVENLTESELISDYSGVKNARSCQSNGKKEMNDEKCDTDEELDQKLERLNNGINQQSNCFDESSTANCYNDKTNSKSEKNVLTNKRRRWSAEKLNNCEIRSSDCSSLEVQIISGDDGCYGDSFVSPLLKKNEFDFEDASESNEMEYEAEKYTEEDLAPLDVKSKSTEETVVVRKTWSLRGWLWGKQSKPNQTEEVAVVIQ